MSNDIGRVFNQEYSVTRHWQSPTYSIQHQLNTPNNSIMYSQPHLSQMRLFSPDVQWSQPQQQNYNIPVGRSNMGQHSLRTVPHLLSSIPADHMICSSDMMTTVTPVFSTLHSSSYTYSQTTTVDTIMTTVQCGNSSQHRSPYSVCDHPTSVASFQVHRPTNM